MPRSERGILSFLSQSHHYRTFQRSEWWLAKFFHKQWSSLRRERDLEGLEYSSRGSLSGSDTLSEPKSMVWRLACKNETQPVCTSCPAHNSTESWRLQTRLQFDRTHCPFWSTYLLRQLIYCQCFVLLLVLIVGEVILFRTCMVRQDSKMLSNHLLN